MKIKTRKDKKNELHTGVSLNVKIIFTYNQMYFLNNQAGNTCKIVSLIRDGLIYELVNLLCF